MWRGAIVFVSILGMFWLSVSALASEQEEVLRREIERVASEITQTEVTVEYLEFSEYSGIAVLHNVSVANPEGFSSDPILAFSRASVRMDPHTLSSDEVVVESIHVREPRLSHELVKGEYNSAILQHNALRYVDEQRWDRDFSFKISRIDIDKGQGTLRIGELFGAAGVQAAIPGAHFANFSGEDFEWTPGMLAARLLEVLVKGATQSLIPSRTFHEAMEANGVNGDDLMDAFCEVPENPHPSYAGPVWICENRPENRK